MRALKITFLGLSLLAAAACTKGRPAEEPQTEQTAEQGFSTGTRVAPNGDPQLGDAYTLATYLAAGTVTQQTIISTAYQTGYYAWDDGTKYGVFNALIPVNVATVAPYGPVGGTAWTRDRTKAQQLNMGTAPLGTYRTAIIYPAIPMRNAAAGSLGFLGVYNLTDKVWASSPDDAFTGMFAPNVPAGATPFQFTVTYNSQINPVPEGTKLYPVRAAIKLWFYSEYYDDDDVAHATPHTQTISSFNSLRLKDMGRNGWYNARTGIVYPNYNYGSTYATVYSNTPIGVDNTNADPADNDYKDIVPTADGVTTGFLPGLLPTTVAQFTAEQAVFPSDYRGSANGGLIQVMPMSVAMELVMGGGGTNKVSIPIALKMDHGKQYNFFINCKSEQITIIYGVATWDDVLGDYTGIGNLTGYATINLTTVPTIDWELGGGGSDNIGN